MAKQSKRFRALAAKRKEDALPLPEAVKAIKAYDGTKFDQSIEIAIRLGIDNTQAEQLVRGSIVLPHGIGKQQRVVVFAKGAKAEEAKKAGADLVGAEELAAEVNAGKIDFDRCIATPDMMGIVGRLGKVLGPRNLMPNPKVGTVTMDVTKAVTESKAGKVEYRTDRNAIVHLVIGKRDFEERRLLENYAAVIDELIRAKPSAAKGRYLHTITVTTTMGPGVKVDPSRTRDIVEEPVPA